MKKFLSWAIVVIFFFLILSINTTRINLEGGLEAFFDFTKWEDVTYWVQLIANTLFLVYLYSVMMLTKKNALIDEDKDIADFRTKLFGAKDEIIANNKRGLLDDYLDMVVNMDEKLDERAYALELRRKRFIRFKGIVAKCDEEIATITKYRTALRSDIDKLKDIDLNVHAIVKPKKPVTFDTLFDIMDYAKPNKKIRIGYSDTAEARKLIAKSPFSSVTTVFMSILAFGNVLTWNTDTTSIIMLMGAVTIAALIKWYNAIKDAEMIARNKKRSLSKAYDEVTAFKNYPKENLEKLRVILFAEKDVKEKKDFRNWNRILTIET